MSKHRDDDHPFRAAVAGVRPLQTRRRALPHTPAPPPVPVQTRREWDAVLRESLEGPISPDEGLEIGEELVYLRDGMSRHVLRQLRRGHWVVQAGIDLHGMDRNEAAERVAAFLLDCSNRGLRCVRIVHGKGLGSRNREPVLKNKLRIWLPRRDEVLAFCQAPDDDGGSGAVLILLKARR
ncbi:MAG: Smr/MutS family protein [Betaproteobacteria bacterium]|nr:Smr/MutS family protein [Betaproteobacteria bacterium]